MKSMKREPRTFMNKRTEKLTALLHLSRELGNPQRPLAILGENNTSARLSDKTFLVKASGSLSWFITQRRCG